jgi:S-adenosylmethionine:tRNA ribosyltransferase-isomerase
MDVASFDFELPDELIAQAPPARRGDSRLLVMHRDSATVEHSCFSELGDHLCAGDLLVVNETKVFPARLLGRRVPSGGAVECLLIRKLSTGDVARGPEGPCLPGANSSSPGADLGANLSKNGSFQLWDALMHPGQKLKVGARVIFERADERLHGEVVGRHFHGRRTIRLWSEERVDIDDAIDRLGHVPLPPYIKRGDQPDDRERYQTVYARERGSVAAPTAGLHFTKGLLDTLVQRGIERTEITLHVGYGTFKPMRAERVEDHVVDPETFVVSSDAAAALTRARRDRRRIIAVGTTTVRALESVMVSGRGAKPKGARERGERNEERADEVVRIEAQQGETNLFIRPGHEFRLVNGMITNFHLPRSSLLVLVAAFAGRERILEAYRDAIARGYRFYSYGDAMLIV